MLFERINTYLDKELLKRYGYSVAGITCKAKLIANRLLRYLLKYIRRGVYSKWNVLKKPFDVITCTFLSDDGLLVVGNDETVMMVVKREYEECYHKILSNVLTEDSIFIDVGAHLGTFTLRAARKCINGLVLAFEPDPRVYPFLLRNIMLNNLKNVIALPIALHNRRGTSRFYVSKISGISTLMQYHHIMDVRNAEEVIVPTLPLDDVVEIVDISRVDIIKIDVEGAEHYVIEGATKTIERHRPILLIEFHGKEQWKEVARTLATLGYEIIVLHKYPFCEYCWNTVAYWKHDTKVKKLIVRLVPKIDTR